MTNTNYHVKTEHVSMIDLHMHLLPAIDDGAASLDVSRRMLAEAQANGFGTLVATPHLSGALTSQFSQQVDAAYAAVCELAEPFGIEVLLGFELLLTPDLPRRLVQGERVTLSGSRTVLVELPFALWPSHTEQTLFDLQVAGYRPLLAHPERYHAVQEDPERACIAAERGAVLQITIGSLTGMFGRSARSTAEYLLESVDSVVVATDAHSAGRRSAAVAEGMQRLRRLGGDSFAQACIVDGPHALLTDARMPIQIDRDSAERSAGWGDRLRRMLKSRLSRPQALVSRRDFARLYCASFRKKQRSTDCNTSRCANECRLIIDLTNKRLLSAQFVMYYDQYLEGGGPTTI